ncbi:MAG: TonB-dependent receptor [Acidobacteriota bacterium]
MRESVKVTLLSTAIMLLPAAAFAQSAIAGVVKDSSGAVMPGVSVEAASDVLIEKVRAAVTDGSGQYRIIDLRPGSYVVTFTLNGFSTVKREGIEITAEFTASVNAEMKVGTLAETITVAGETPIVDVQSAKRVRTFDSELLQSLPSAKGYASVMLLIPSMVQSGGGNVNVQLSPGMVVFGGQGGRGNEGRVQVDGLNTGASLNGGGVSGYRQDMENAAEVAMSTAGGLGETEVGGPTLNVVPRTGGNRFAGHFFFTGLNGSMQSDNFTQRLIDSGLRRPNHTNYLYDTSVSAGGPIIKDRLWYFSLLYYRGSGNDVSTFRNLNAGDLTKWTYVPDLSSQVKSDGNGPLQPNLRLTLQPTARNRVNLFWDEQISNDSIGQGSATAAPETGAWNHGFQRVQQAKWTSTTTNKLLLEAGIGTYLSNWNNRETPGNDRRFIQVTEQCTAGCPTNGGIANFQYRGLNSWSHDWIGAHTWNAAASYITGANTMKFGYQGAYHTDNRAPGGNDVSYRFNNAIPNQLTETINYYRSYSRVRYDALYAQDNFTRGRLTVQGAVRFDHSWSYYPEQSIGGVTFLPGITVFPESRGVEGYKDITPRMGASFDLFGNGKTALKVNMGRYLEAAVNGNGNYSELLPSSRVPRSVTRTWTDSNGNFNPDCDLTNVNAQDLRTAGQDFCGQISQLAFGRSNPTLSYDPNIMQGWGVRPGDWQLGVTVQRELIPRVSLEVGYTRRWLQNFTVTDNRATSLADYSPYSIVAPLDPRLPGGGGYTVSGLYDVVPARSGVTDNLRTSAVNYGTLYQNYNGVDVNVNARLRNGLQFQAGSSTGQRVTDYCDIRAKLPGQTGTFSTGSEVPAYSLVNPNCHFAPGVATRATAAGSYTIPKIAVLLSGSFQSSPGIPLAANYVIPAATIAQTLGRAPSGNVTNVTVNLLKPDDLRSERVNQLDWRVGKVLKFGRQRATISADLFNALNNDAILTYNQAFIPGGAWNVPTGVLTARTTKITVQWDF